MVTRILRNYYITEDKDIYIRNRKTKTIFQIDLEKDKLICKLCNEELGEVSDKNIDHQGNYHSCPIKTPPGNIA